MVFPGTRARGKWEARLMVDGRNKYVGRFSDMKEAEMALEAARERKRDDAKAASA